MDIALVSGCLAIAAWACHVYSKYTRFGRTDGLLWLCHLGSLYVGVGGVLHLPGLNGVGLSWLSFGVLCWALDLAAGGEFRWSSALTHVGGWVSGLVIARQIGFPSYTWLLALVLAVLVQRYTRMMTSEERNINCAFRSHRAVALIFPSYRSFWIASCLVATMVFGVTELLVRN